MCTDRSTTKAKTFDPCWNEMFIHEVNNAKNIGLTVFHDAALSQDDFIANCNIPFDELAHRDKEQQDFWVCVFDGRKLLEYHYYIPSINKCLVNLWSIAIHFL